MRIEIGELTGFETAAEIALLEQTAEPEDLDRFKRLRPMLGRYSKNAEEAHGLGDFLFWYGKFIDYSGTIRNPKVTGNAGDDRILLAGYGIAGESGEVADVIKKIYFHDGDNKDTIKPDRRAKLIEEWGDRFWYDFNAMRELGIEMREILQANMVKLTVDPRTR